MMRRLGLLALGVLLAFSSSAAAQDGRRVEVSGGWRFYHADFKGSLIQFDVPKPNDFSRGWYADIAGKLSPKFAIVGEAGGTYHSDQFDRTSSPSFSSHEELHVQMHTFMGGLRISAPQNPSIVPFGQITFGGEHYKGVDERTSTFSTGPPSRITSKAIASGALLALDSGVTVGSGRFAARVAAGYLRFFGKLDADAFRLSVGGVARF